MERRLVRDCVFSPAPYLKNHFLRVKFSFFLAPCSDINLDARAAAFFALPLCMHESALIIHPQSASRRISPRKKQVLRAGELQTSAYLIYSGKHSLARAQKFKKAIQLRAKFD